MTTQKITVGEQTLSYIKCLQQADILYSCLYNAFELNYGNRQAEDIMQREYHNKSNQIYEMINSYMCISIGENIGCSGELTTI